MKRLAVPIVLSLAICVGGCASTHEKTDSLMQAWVGDSVDHLVASWGQPREVRYDGSGGRILVYMADRPGAAFTNTTTIGPDHSAVGWESTGTGGSYRAAGAVEYRMFWADKDGTIYKWQRKGP